MPNTFSATRLQNAKGATIISLMIAMLVSIMSVVAILALYKNLVGVSVNATSDAQHDGHIATAILTAQLELQTAGYGIENAGSEHLNANAAGTELRWRYLDGGNYQCRALRETAVSDNVRRLALFEATANCTADSALSGLQWQELTVLANIERVEAMPDQIFTFSVSTAKCSPYGIGEKEKHLIANIRTMSAADFNDTGNAIAAATYPICIASTHPS